MAEFNPQTPDTGIPNNLGYSRGPGVNRSFEALFSGLGDAISSGVQTADNFVQNKIEDQTRAGTEQINREFGFEPDSVPSELLQSQEGLQRLAMAQQQGKVTPEYYFQRLAAQTKALRAKYPGYEEQIDNIVQKVTGLNPANAFRQAILSNIDQANARAASSADKFQTWVNQNQGYIQMTNPDYFNDPSKYAGKEQQLQADVAKIKGQEQTWEYQKAQIGNNKEFGTQIVNERLNQITSNAISSPSKALGLSGADFYKRLDQLQKSGGGTPDEIAELNNLYTQFRANAQAQMFAAIGDINVLSPTEKQAQINAALAPLDQIKQAIDDKNYSQAATIAARNELAQNRATAAIYQHDPRIAGVAALGKIAPQLAQDAMQNIVGEQGTNLDYLTRTAILDQMGGIVEGNDTLADAQNRIANNDYDTAAGKAQKINTINAATVAGIKDTNADPQQWKNLVNGAYGNPQTDAFSKVPPDQYLSLYNQMYNPEVTKAIAARGDKQALDVYTNSAIDRFQAIPAFRQAAQDLASNTDYAKYLSVAYDEKNNRVVVTADQDAIRGARPFEANDNRFALQRAAKAADSLNQALSIMAPIVEANGGNELEGITQVLQNVGLTLNADKKSGFWNWIVEQLDNQKQAGEETRKSITDKLQAPALPSIQDILQGRVGGFRDAVTGFEQSMGQETQGVNALEPSGQELTQPDVPQISTSPINYLFSDGSAVENEKSGSEDSFLNLLGKSEGTDRGRSYNETLGYGAFTGGDVDLTKMSLNQIDFLQSEMLQHPDNRWNSSALGRYQIVRTTLRSLRKELGLSGDTKFTPEVQDRLAKALIERRGYSQWKRGEISTSQFMNNLAKEWASLPTTSGKGAYSGQNASVRTSDVRNALMNGGDGF